MTYPTLTPRSADQVADAIRFADPDDVITTLEADSCVGADGADYPRAAVESAAETAQAAWSTQVDRLGLKSLDADLYLLEAFMAEHIHRTVQALPIDLREDPGFWRYLALFPFRWYLKLREPELQPQDYGGTKPDKDRPDKRHLTQANYQLLFRTYLWGKIAFGKPNPDKVNANEKDLYRRATLVNETNGAPTDVWHSHMVRVQLGQLGHLPHAFIDSICDEPRANTTKPARLVEKRLTRMKHNILLDVYDAPKARALVDEQKTLALNK